MKATVNEIVFLTCLLLLGSVPRIDSLSLFKKKQLPPTATANKPTSSKTSSYSPFNGEMVNFVLDLTVEPPTEEEVFRDAEGKDFLGLKKDVNYAGFNYTQVLADDIKDFLSNNGLTNHGFSRPKNFGFATTDERAPTATFFFGSLANKLFNPECDVNKRIVMNTKTLIENNKQELYLAQDLGYKMDFFLLSNGVYRKMHGLNMLPSVCPAIYTSMQDRWANDVKEYKSWISLNHFYDFFLNLTDDFKNKTFHGRSEAGDYWTFNGTKQSFRTNGQDLYNFINTVYHDTQFKDKLPEITEGIWETISDIREQFFYAYLPKNTTDIIGQRFIHFITYMLNQKDYYENSPTSPFKGVEQRKWLTIGVKDIAMNFLSKFFEANFNISFGHKFHIGSSVYFVFSGTHQNDIKTVWVYRAGNLLGHFAFKDLLAELSDLDITDTKPFNDFCIGRDNVESLTNDY